MVYGNIDGRSMNSTDERILMPDRKTSHKPRGLYSFILGTRYMLRNAKQKKRNENSGEGYFPGRSSKYMVLCKKDCLRSIISSMGTYDDRANFTVLPMK